MNYDVYDVLRVFSNAAPLALGEEYQARYSAYDNSGIILNMGEETSGVLCCLDLTNAAVDAAIKHKYKVIVTHHPPIFKPIKSLSVADRITPANPLLYAAKNGISVISMHLNADVAEHGVDYFLMCAVKAACGAKLASETATIYQPLSIPDTGYGRKYSFERRYFNNIATDLAINLDITRMEAYGGERTLISSAASFCGAGLDEDSLKFALDYRVDLVITGEVKHHVLTAAIESGLKVIVLTHYGSENYPFSQFCQQAIKRSGLKMVYLNNLIMGNAQI